MNPFLTLVKITATTSIVGFFLLAATSVSAAGFSQVVQEQNSEEFLNIMADVDYDLFPASMWKQNVADIYAATGVSSGTYPHVLLYSRTGFSNWMIAFCDEQIKLEKTSTTLTTPPSTIGLYRFQTAGGSTKTTGCVFYRYATGLSNYPDLPILSNIVSVSHSSSLYIVDEGLDVLPDGGSGCWTWKRLPAVHQTNLTIAAINNFITEGSGNADIGTHCDVWDGPYSASLSPGGGTAPPVDSFEVLDKETIQTAITDALEGTIFEPFAPALNIIVGFVVDFINWIANFLYEVLDWIINTLIIPPEGALQESLDAMMAVADDKFPGLSNLFEPFAELIDTSAAVPSPITFTFHGETIPMLDLSGMDPLLDVVRPYLSASLGVGLIFFLYNIFTSITTSQKHSL